MSTAMETSNDTIPDANHTPSFEIFEFFAGLGGFHLSLPAGLKVHSITAIEIDRRAGEVYRLNLHRSESSTPTQNVTAAANSNIVDPTPAAPASSSSSTPSSVVDPSQMSAKARMKANRKIFFEKQRLDALERGDEGFAERKKKKQKRKKEDDVTAVNDAADAAAAESPSAAQSTPVVPADAASSPSASPPVSSVPKRLITTTTMSTFSLPPRGPSPHADIISSVEPPKLLLRLIEQLSPSQLVSSSPKERESIWCMSPPCQPFTQTKNSKQLGGADPRNAAFEWLMKTLKELSWELRPRFLFLENVKHFYRSDMWTLLLSTLRAAGYTYEQYLISPIQIGIPNHRLRFYVAARKMTVEEANAMTEQQWTILQDRLHITPPGYSSTDQQKQEAKELMVKIAVMAPKKGAPDAIEDEDDVDGAVHDSPGGAASATTVATVPTKSNPIDGIDEATMRRFLNQSESARADLHECIPRTTLEEQEEREGEMEKQMEMEDVRVEEDKKESPSVTTNSSYAMPKPSALPLLITPNIIQPYLDSGSFASDELTRVLTLPSHLLTKPFHLSVVSPFDRRTFCVTGAYGKVVHTSSGSFLLFSGPQVDRGESLTFHPLDKSQGWLPYIEKIRWFSPQELLRLFGFPEWYRFPGTFTVRNCYKLIGNSINISIVRGILRKHLASVCVDTPEEIPIDQIQRQ